MAKHTASILSRVGFGFFCLAALLVVFALFAWESMRAIKTEFDLVQDDRLPKIEQVARIKQALDQNALNYRGLVMLAEDQRDSQAGAGGRLDHASLVQVAQRQIQLNDQVISQALAELDRVVKTPQGRADLAKVVQARQAYFGPRADVFESLRSGQIEVARRVLLVDLQPKQAAYMMALDELASWQSHLMHDSAAEVERSMKSAQAIMVAMLLLGGIGAFGFARWTISGIDRPLQRLSATAKQILAGDLTVTFDLSAPVELHALVQAIDHLRDKKRNLVSDVRQIAVSSGGLAAESTEIRGATESQAAALEQTAASMEELSASVQTTTQNAQAASNLANNAKLVAQDGHAVISRVVATMVDISEGSKRVTEITALIDGIAFQTNILALNAAVEAARAGEHGRGFNVVASEVRTLAQRTSQAAKEIGTLIHASVSQIEVGEELVRQAGTTMGDLLLAVEKVNQLVEDISLASKEQSAGVQQVGLAIEEIDKAVQVNVAALDASAGNAAHMHEMSEALLQNVSSYTI